MITGFKIRIYPTKEQEKLIWQHIGACRFIWNYMLDLQIKRYKNGEKHLSRFDMIKLLTPLKHYDEYAWLRDVSNASLQRTCSVLAEDYTSFFRKHSEFPRFKSRKRSKPSFPIRSDSMYFKDRCVKVEKIGFLKYKSDLIFPQGSGRKFSDARISCINGKYMLSFGMERENQTPQLTGQSMGIDLGIKELAVVAYGNERVVFHNINKSKKIRDLKRKLKRVQRSISRKYEASKARTGEYEKTKNIERMEANARKIHARLIGIRHNYLHQITHKLVSMSPHTVVMEDLNVRGMMRNKYLSACVAEQCLYEFIRQMRYKCKRSGIQFIQVSRFYPSSKTCSCCGAIKKNLRLNDRTYICSECGFTIDRDYNAAINLMRYADLQTQATA